MATEYFTTHGLGIREYNKDNESVDNEKGWFALKKVWANDELVILFRREITEGSISGGGIIADYWFK